MRRSAAGVGRAASLLRLARRQLAAILALALVQQGPSVAQQADPSRLRIDVREGQNAANNVRSRTGVAPVVVVRDERGEAVAGARVTFELPGAGPGGSFHGWMRAETLRTDAEGRAAASTFAPNGELGPFEIRVTAESGGKSASASIRQTNGPDVPPAVRTVRRPKRRTIPLIVLGASVGYLAALTVRNLKRHPGSPSGWWGAASVAGLTLTTLAMAARQRRSQVDKFATAAGPVEITPIHHASLMIRSRDGVMHVDPTAEVRYDGMPRADLVLVTEARADHFDPATVRELLKTGAAAFGPEAAVQAAPGITVIRIGERTSWRNWTIEAVPAYNLPGSDEPGAVFHEKGRGNGYVLAFGGKRFFFSGNTGNTPELRALPDVDVAFVCMNPPYTMPGVEAAEAVRAFHPKVAYPYHYRGDLLSVYQFRDALQGTGIEVRIRSWYE